MNELDHNLTEAFFDVLEKCERDPAEAAKTRGSREVSPALASAARVVHRAAGERHTARCGRAV
jgi:hypothetical protein